MFLLTVTLTDSRDRSTSRADYLVASKREAVEWRDAIARSLDALGWTSEYPCQIHSPETLSSLQLSKKGLRLRVFGRPAEAPPVPRDFIARTLPFFNRET